MDSDEDVVRNELDPKKHAQFINDVLSLNKRPQLAKASRTEPTVQISEFNLVKSVTGKQGGVRLDDLTKVLQKRAKHVEISSKVTSVGRRAKTLLKPLDKPKAERIKRTIAFENVRKQLDRWDPVVTSNRASNRLSFPLSTSRLETSKNFSGFRLKSDLQKELESLEPTAEIFNLEKKSEFPLTMQEMLQRRKEMAKMRAVQSYRESKARRQSKIKSKKYHRVQRREKINKQMKEFEQLQKTDPAEALKKLDEIERVRAEERASLRHRSTGKWARNKQVQAKYDKDSRQVLAQQLALSRDLTQKVKAAGESDSDEDANGSAPVTGGNNPWTNSLKASGEVESFLSRYRKFWEDQNKEGCKEADQNTSEPKLVVVETSKAKAINPEKNKGGLKDGKTINKSNEKQIIKEKKQSVEKPLKIIVNGKNVEKQLTVKVDDKITKQSTKKLKRNKKPRVGTTEWDISTLESEDSEDNKDIDEIFDDVDSKLQQTVQNKYTKLKKELEQPTKQKAKNKPKPPKTNKIDLSIPKPATRPIIDEELIVTETEPAKNSLKVLNAILQDGSHMAPLEKPVVNNVIAKKAVNLSTDIPDLLMLDDNEENVDQKGTITEAFEDDDIVAEFKKDKRVEIESEKPKDINLELPGWGDWGGTGIVPSKRQNKRFIIKFPKKFDRRDDNKGHLIINEKANAKVKMHMVSELPFPFRKVKDFEASIRAPIGSTFVPETAYRRLIKPAVTTKRGAIIEPMTEEVLLKKKK